MDKPSYVAALAGTEAGLFVGGHFQFTGGKPAADFGEWLLPLRLRILGVNDSARISWPAAAHGFELFEADDPGTPWWTPVTARPAIEEGRWQVTIAPPAGRGYYLLQKR